MKKTANKLQIELVLEGNGLVNYNGSKAPARFYGDMMVNGKQTDNGSFAKENIYKETIVDKEGQKKDIFIPKKIVSSNLIRKMILGDENDINADKLANNDVLRAAYLSQDNVIARGYCILGKSNVDVKRKSAFTVTNAEQTSNTVTWLETKTTEGVRDETSLFFKETCGDIEYKAQVFVDIRQLQFISIDDNYDRLALADGDAAAFIQNIDKRYGEGNATYGNWATSNKNVVGEQGIILSNKVVTNIIRESVKKLLSVDIKRAGAYAKTKSIKLAIGLTDDVFNLNATPNFVEIKSIEDFDSLVGNIEFGVEFLPIVAPTIEKFEKKAKEEKKKK